jgi:hypothetical protein
MDIVRSYRSKKVAKVRKRRRSEIGLRMGVLWGRGA